MATLPAGDTDDDASIEAAGDALVTIATAVRRFKSENGLSLGGELARLQIVTDDAPLADWLWASATDLRSVTRAATVEVVTHLNPTLRELAVEGTMRVAIQR